MSILKIEGLTKSFGGVMAVGGVNLQVDENQINSIIGPNGAGKTTLFNLITGLHKADSGRVIFKDQDVSGVTPEKIVNMGMGRSFQVTNIFPKLTVFENVQAAIVFRLGKGMSLFSRAEKHARTETEKVLNMVELLDNKDDLGGVLSAGDRKRLELGIVLAGKPDMVLLDEPTCGMSPTETTSTIDLIKKIAEETSLTVLFTEHKMDMVFSISSHITVMNFGRVIAEGSPEQISDNTKVQSIYFGEQ